VLEKRHAQFSPGYQGTFSPGEAVQDLEELDQLARHDGGLAIQARAYRKPDDAHNALRLKLYLLGEVMPLSVSLPIFENLGMKVIAEDPFPITFDTEDGWTREAVVLDFLMERA